MSFATFEYIDCSAISVTGCSGRLQIPSASSPTTITILLFLRSSVYAYNLSLSSSLFSMKKNISRIKHFLDLSAAHASDSEDSSDDDDDCNSTSLSKFFPVPKLNNSNIAFILDDDMFDSFQCSTNVAQQSPRNNTETEDLEKLASHFRQQASAFSAPDPAIEMRLNIDGIRFCDDLKATWLTEPSNRKMFMLHVVVLLFLLHIYPNFFHTHYIPVARYRIIIKQKNQRRNWLTSSCSRFSCPCWLSLHHNSFTLSHKGQLQILIEHLYLQHLPCLTRRPTRSAPTHSQ